MSRVGKNPIPIPSGVTVQISPDAVEVKGPKGTLRQLLPPGILIEMADGRLEARPEREDRALGKFHGLARSLVANAVTWVSEGFKKELDIPVIWVGGFQSVEAIAGALERGDADAVSSGRQFIADPFFYRHLREGRAGPTCDFCNRCLARTGYEPVDCYNPTVRAAKEALLREAGE